MRDKHAAEHRTDLRPFTARMDLPAPGGDVFARRHADWKRRLLLQPPPASQLQQQGAAVPGKRGAPASGTALSAPVSSPPASAAAVPKTRVRFFKLGAGRLGRMAQAAAGESASDSSSSCCSSSSSEGGSEARSGLPGGGAAANGSFLRSLDYYDDSQVRRRDVKLFPSRSLPPRTALPCRCRSAAVPRQGRAASRAPPAASRPTLPFSNG